MVQTLYSMHLWMVQHPQELEKHVGKWIAVGLNGIISSAASLKQLSEIKEVIEARKEKAVLFTLVPDPLENLFS